MLGNRLFGLPPEVVETAFVGQLAAGLQSVAGPEVLQLRDVFQKAPPMATANPVVVSEQRQDASVFR